MSQTELNQYIFAAHRQGMTNEQIMQALLGVGWHVHDVADLILDRRALEVGENIISVKNLSKFYGSVKALDNISLEVRRGTVTALLGPNGAGKTTLIRVLATLLKPTFGTATVASFDVVQKAQQLRELIGLAGQYAAVDEILTGRENLEMVGRLYHLTALQSTARAKELLKQFELEEAADRPLTTYSGGMRRRLDLAASLVINPKVLFLDEPTAGLDPRSRFVMWNVIRDLVEADTTVLLTTQYMEEADQLAHHVLVMNRGKIIAQGTAEELKRQIGGDVLELHLTNHQDAPVAAALIKPFGNGEFRPDSNTGIVTMPVQGGAAVLVQVIRQLDAAHLKISDIILRRPTMDDVFIKLTGHEAK